MIHNRSRTSGYLAVAAMLFSCFCLVILLPSVSSAANRGILVKARDSSGAMKNINLYSGYHALVVGCGAYSAGWPRLPNPVKDAREVSAMLKGMGWEVEKLEDPDGKTFRHALNKLVIGAGRKKELAILFWYSGHGQTLEEADGTKLGYLVPVDAPDPDKDPLGFMNTAISMRVVETVSKQIRSKHVLMAFDSCFSGAIFQMVRAKPSPYVQEKVAWPVRQFITAGTEDEQVPDRSVFKDVFIQGVRDGFADMNNDSYITGEELGSYLQENVVNYSRKAQHPQFGKINNPKLDKGDFVFLTASSGAVVDTPAPASTATQGRLSVSSNVTGAQVIVDGKFVGGTPLMSLELSSGFHRVQVKKDGYDTYRTNVEITSGRLASLEAYLTEQGPKTARLYVDTTPSDARIRILNIGPKYSQGMELAPGDYHIEVSAGGYGKQTRWVSLAAGEDKRISFSLSGGQAAAPSIAAQGQPSPGQIWKDSVTGMEFVWVPGGCYQMGQTDEEKAWLIKEVGQEKYEEWYKDELPRHKVCVDGFWMGKHEVTRGQFRQFITAEGYRTDADKKGKAKIFNKSTEWKWKEVEGHNWQNPGYDQTDSHPVATVSWNDAKAFSKWLSRRSGQTFCLPTEAQWEYAARAGTTSMRFWGDDDGSACAYANIADKTAFPGDPGKKWNSRFECNDGFFFTAPVGSFKPNPYGLYDMLGNVWEWCEDGYDSKAYAKHSTMNPVITSGSLRVNRGGSWNDIPSYVRAALRYGDSADYRYAGMGFRLCLPQVRH